MAATYGQIQEFSPQIESIEAYFEAGNIDAERRVAEFCSVIGGKKP